MPSMIFVLETVYIIVSFLFKNYFDVLWKEYNTNFTHVLCFSYFEFVIVEYIFFNIRFLSEFFGLYWKISSVYMYIQIPKYTKVLAWHAGSKLICPKNLLLRIFFVMRLVRIFHTNLWFFVF